MVKGALKLTISRNIVRYLGGRGHTHTHTIIWKQV